MTPGNKNLVAIVPEYLRAELELQFRSGGAEAATKWINDGHNSDLDRSVLRVEHIESVHETTAALFHLLSKLQ